MVRRRKLLFEWMAMNLWERCWFSQKEKWAKETVWESKHTDWKSCGFGVTRGWNRNLTEITRVFFGGKGRGGLDEFRLMAASMAIISCSYIFLILQHSTRMKWGRVLFITQFRIYYSSKRDTAFRQTLKSTTTKSACRIRRGTHTPAFLKPKYKLLCLLPLVNQSGMVYVIPSKGSPKYPFPAEDSRWALPAVYSEDLWTFQPKPMF